MVSFVLIYNLINEDYFGERIVVSRIELDKYFFMSSKTLLYFFLFQITIISFILTLSKVILTIK